MTPKAPLTPFIAPNSSQSTSTQIGDLPSLSPVTPTSSPHAATLLPDELRHLVATQWPNGIERLEKAKLRLLVCNEVPIDRLLPIEVRQDFLLRPYLTNVRRCGLVNFCPVCRERILRRRAARWRRDAHEVARRGGVVYFVTLTLPHHQRSLTAGLDLLGEVKKKTFASGKAAVSQKVLGFLGFAYQVETVYDGVRGWNPHLHGLIYCQRPVPWLATWLADRYSTALEGLGVGRCPGAATIEEAQSIDAVVNYVLKLGEAEQGPLELALAGAAGSAKARQLFGEFVQSVHGQRLTCTARGLSKYLKRRQEATDQEINLRDGATGAVLHSFSRSEWQQVVECRLQSQVLSTLGTR
ncbi:hypothetical protein E7T06_08880 [Deinococcus sp. Arct2-2]|nr:hypothetical protein E7T06_08880 [Deinococcus sp. Arct2-2]